MPVVGDCGGGVSAMYLAAVLPPVFDVGTGLDFCGEGGFSTLGPRTRSPPNQATLRVRSCWCLSYDQPIGSLNIFRYLCHYNA